MPDLIMTALPVAELLIIKRDFDLLMKIVTNLQPELQMQLTPYTALFCYEAIEYLNKKGSSVTIEQTSQYSIKNARLKAKFFDLSTNKLIESIRYVDKMQNDYFVHLMKYPELEKWNIHDNIGIWFDKDKNIVGNTHYAYYVFQDEKMIGKSFENIKDYVIQSEEIRSFAYDMGRIIGSISSGLTSVSDFIKGDISFQGINILNHDFNTNRCHVIENDEYKIIRLFLLHVLSSIGFIIYVLKKCIINETGILLRLEYITYHYTLKRLKSIRNFCCNQRSINDINLIDALNSIDYSDNKCLLKTEFRNCMMHFGLSTEDNVSLIDETKLDLSIPLCGLVESQFNMRYSEYKGKIEGELIDIAETLKHYLDFEYSLDVGN